jgi:signal transduction histidine kinase
MTEFAMPLRQWMWRAFSRGALVPLVLVELVLIAIYLFTNSAIRDGQIAHLQQRAVSDLGSAAKRESQMIAARLTGIEGLVALLRDASAHALHNEHFRPDPAEVARHRLNGDGIFHTTHDNGGAASFYANSTPPERQDHARAIRLSQIDPLMRSINQTNALVSAAYFNTWDSYNRIYPFFDTPSQYPHDMVIPDYNFYYLADAHHNAERKVVWTDVYLDPAGQGWMMSAIAPVYSGDFLEGVAGLDITVSRMLEEISELQVPWQGYAMLVSRDHHIMALPEAGERDFGLDELTDHSYAEAIHHEVLKPEDFSLARRTDMQPLLAAMARNDGNVLEVLLQGRRQLIAWSAIPQTGWQLLLVVDEAQIFHDTNRLADGYRRLGYWLIAGLVAFYAVFFAWMWTRSRRLSNELAQPIAGVAGMLEQIGHGNFRPAPVHSRIAEVSGIATAVVDTGRRLETAQAGLQQAVTEAQEAAETKSRFLSNMSHEFRTPLNAISGFGQLLSLEQDPAIRSQAEEIVRASDHLAALVEDILDFSSLDRGTRLVLEPIDAAVLVAGCVELIQADLEQHGLALECCELPPELWLQADARRLKQILLNLLSNAIKYNRPGGTVRIGGELDGGCARLWVEDSGEGLTVEQQAQLFVPFQRLGRENSTIPGTGIGLVLSRELAQRMRGEIGFSSEPGRGSRFWVEVPVVSGER